MTRGRMRASDHKCLTERLSVGTICGRHPVRVVPLAKAEDVPCAGSSPADRIAARS